MLARRAILAGALSLGACVALKGTAQAQTMFSDQEMRAFAGATLDLQSLSSQDPAAMTHVIQAAGMSVEQYNRMGDAMRADPALADRLNPYLDQAREARIGRSSGATSYDPNRPYDPGTGRRRASSSSSRRRKTTKKTRGKTRKGSSKSKRRTTSKSRKRSAASSKKRTTTKRKTTTRKKRAA